MQPPRLAFATFAVVLLTFAVAPSSAGHLPSAPTLVASAGNEPLIRVDANGIIYIAALQHLYKSTTSAGTAFTDITPPIFAATVNLNSDSSIALAPDGKTLYMSFDWPYLGSTAVCMTTTIGIVNWICNPEAVPGATDRMWIRALADGNTMLVTGIGLQVTTTFVSVSPGTLVYIPAPIQPVSCLLCQTGDFAPGWGPTAFSAPYAQLVNTAPESSNFYSASGSFTGSASAPFQNTAIPFLALDGGGHYYAADEGASGTSLVVERTSSISSPSWTASTVTSTGTSRFASISAGDAGHVSVLYYWTSSTSSFATASWVVKVAESTNADGASPTWTIRQLSTGTAHIGDLCSSTACGGTSRFAGDFVSGYYDTSDVPRYVWMEDNNGLGIPAIYTSL